MKFGFEIFSDQLAPNHTFGTFGAAGETPKVAANALAGATTIAVDGGNAAETLVRGDVFTIAGVKTAKGVLIPFVVLGNYAATSGAIAAVNIYPALPANVAHNAAITVVAPGSGTNYAISMAFHRDAFMFAARSLQTEQSENSTISVAIDPVTGIPLRLETWRDPVRSRRIWRFDVLFGVKTLRPELACRFHG